MTKTVCVYCGSRKGDDERFAAAADALAAAICARGMRLVYGGGHVGLMGVVADGVLRRGGEVIGVIPQAMMRKEVAHEGLTELHVTADMHERKAMMAARADAFVAMPGGLGTLEELFETWTWLQLRYHDKPIGMLNVDGYFDGLLAFLDGAVARGFVSPDHRALLQADDDPTALLARLL